MLVASPSADIYTHARNKHTLNTKSLLTCCCFGFLKRCLLGFSSTPAVLYVSMNYANVVPPLLPRSNPDVRRDSVDVVPLGWRRDQLTGFDLINYLWHRTHDADRWRCIIAMRWKDRTRKATMLLRRRRRCRGLHDAMLSPTTNGYRVMRPDCCLIVLCQLNIARDQMRGVDIFLTT